MPRRTFIRGLGVGLAMPFMDCMLPWASKALAQAAGKPHLIVLYKPNGQFPGSWKVNNFAALPTMMQSLNGIKNEVTFIQGMNNRASAQYGDGHAPRLACFLTGGPITASTSNVIAPKSIDQIIADARATTALTVAGPFEYPTDNGFNGEYFSSLSWKGPRAAQKIKSPRALFDSLFANPTPTVPNTAAINKVYKQSVLDFAKEEVARKMASLGSSDKKKLDEYLTGVREVEVAINKAETTVIQCTADTGRPLDNNGFEVHTKLMLDLIIKSLQCGRTDVVSYMFDTEVGNGYMDHHGVSHYSANSTYPQKLMSVDQFYISQFAYFITKLNSIQTATGSLLANSAVIFGSGTGDSDSHDPNDIPVLLAGRAGGLLTPGKVLTKAGAPVSNLMLTMLNKMGVARTSFGDSTGQFADV
jgi:hypothetical protein